MESTIGMLFHHVHEADAFLLKIGFVVLLLLDEGGFVQSFFGLTVLC
jgi:hypothetical protein